MASTSLNLYINQLISLGKTLDDLRRMLDVDEDAPYLVEELHGLALEATGYHNAALVNARQTFSSIEKNEADSARNTLAASSRAYSELMEKFYKDLYTLLLSAYESVVKNFGSFRHLVYLTLPDGCGGW